MKDLVNKLKDFVTNELGNDLNITGQEYMELSGITINDLANYSEEFGYLYDYFNIEIDPKYIPKLKQKFTEFNEVIWYETPDSEDEKYVEESLDVIHKDCKWILTEIYKPGKIEPFNTSLKEIVSSLSSICEVGDVINLTLDYLYDIYLFIDINDKGVKNIRFEIDKITSLSKEEELLLLFQLIVISYDVPLLETLKMLRLMK